MSDDVERVPPVRMIAGIGFRIDVYAPSGADDRYTIKVDRPLTGREAVVLMRSLRAMLSGDDVIGPDVIQ